MSDVFMVVVSYNGRVDTVRTIEALRKQTYKPRILLWDNASTDETPETIAGNYPDVETYPSPENLLWTPAINTAIDKLWNGEPYIGFMNNDITLSTRSVERMLDVMQNDPEVGIVAPMGSRLGGPQDWAANIGEAPNGTLESINHRIRNNVPYRAPYVVGACCMMPKKVWDEIGPLDAKMPLGADDHDYSMRIKHAGYKIIVCSNIYASHVGHASRESENWALYGGPSWDVFNRKWDSYYKTEEEAVKCHWGGEFWPDFTKGTGWTEEEYEKRIVDGVY